MKYMTAHVFSDAISAKPGITPVRLAEQLDLPMVETMRTLEMLRHNSTIMWNGGVNDPIQPVSATAEDQLQSLKNAGIEVDRQL